MSSEDRRTPRTDREGAVRHGSQIIFPLERRADRGKSRDARIERNRLFNFVLAGLVPRLSGSELYAITAGSRKSSERSMIVMTGLDPVIHASPGA